MQTRIFLPRLALGAALLGTVAGLAGCNLDINNKDEIKPMLRVIDLASQQTALTVTVGDVTVATSANYQQVGDFNTVHLGSQTIYVKNASGSTLYTLAPSLAQSTHYSLYLYSSGTNVSVANIEDNMPSVGDDKFVVRTFGASSAFPAFDLYVTGANDDLSALSPTVSGATVGQMASYSSEIAAGTYRVRLTQTGTKTVVFDNSAIEFKNKGAYTLAFHSIGSALLPTVLETTPDDNSAVVLANSLSRVRVVQGTPDVASTRVAIDGTTLYQAMPFGGVTNYVTQPAGAHNVTFANDGSPDSPFITVRETFESGKDYTVFATGAVAAASGLTLADNNLPVTIGSVRGRFINATHDQASVDVVVNYQPLASGLQAGASSGSVDLDPIAYPLSFAASGSSTPLAQLTTDTLTADGSYSMALIGNAGNYKIVVFKAN